MYPVYFGFVEYVLNLFKEKYRTSGIFWIYMCFKCVMEKYRTSGRFWVWVVCVVFFIKGPYVRYFFWIHVCYKCVIEKYRTSGRFWVLLVCVVFLKI